MTTLIRKHASKFFCSLFGLLALGFSLLEMQRAQSRPLPVPLPIAPIPDPISPPAPPLATDLGPSAIFTFADATQIRAQGSSSGYFQLVGLHPSEVIEIALDLPVSLGGAPVPAVPLDGGKILPAAKGRRSIGASSIRFQAGNQPGLYRVLVMGTESRSLLQFWVADPRNPKNNRPVLNPSH